MGYLGILSFAILAPKGQGYLQSYLLISWQLL